MLYFSHKRREQRLSIDREIIEVWNTLTEEQKIKALQLLENVKCQGSGTSVPETD